MNLLIEYFRSDDYQRHSEYLTCIHENLENEYIKKVYIFISDDSKLNFKSDKIEIIQREERPAYKDLFGFCNENLKNEICIISNADIILDDVVPVTLKLPLIVKPVTVLNNTEKVPPVLFVKVKLLFEYVPPVTITSVGRVTENPE